MALPPSKRIFVSHITGEMERMQQKVLADTTNKKYICKFGLFFKNSKSNTKNV